MKKCVIFFIAVFMIGVWCVGLVGAATEAQKQEAIDKGLAWLATQQQTTGTNSGSWYYNSAGTPVPETTAATAAVVMAYSEQYTKPLGWNGANYNTNVTNGLNYILKQAQSVTIGVQTYGNPDTNANGIGYKFVLGLAGGRDTYTTGLVLPALVSYVKSGLNGVTADSVINVPGSAVNGLTYRQVIQDTVDYFAWGQNETGGARGGWRYEANSSSSDNSTAQWPAIGMLYAQSAGATVPQFVKNELKIWIDYIQNSSGGSGYDINSYLVNQAKTGGLLVEMALAGYDGYKPSSDTLGKQEALNYLNTNWKEIANNTWDGNFAHPYAMWSIYKGLDVTIGLDNETRITNLLYPAGIEDNPNHGFNWWEDYCNWLVLNQTAGGGNYWAGYTYWTGVLATAWNINILNATRIPPPGVPEPTTMLLLGLGLLGLAGIRRKM